MESSDKVYYQVSGLKWLYLYELIDDPQLINNLKMNILMVSNRIKETELLFYTINKQLLIYVELDWLGRTFFKEAIEKDVELIVKELLPKFQVRAVSDVEILNSSKKILEEALVGAKLE